MVSSLNISDYCIFETNPQIMYATGRDTTMACFKTEDGGQNWVKWNFHDVKVRGVAVAVDCENSDYAYASGFDNNNGNIVSVILRTTDGGGEWSEVWKDSTLPVVDVIKAQGNRVYAGTTHGIFLSENYGSSWAEPNDSFPVSDMVFYPYRQGISYAGGSRGLYSSNDYGSHWSRIDSNLTMKHVSSLAFDSENSALYAGTIGGSIFKANIATGIPDDNETKPDNYALYQNYPNPFNAQTSIKIFLPASGKVKLEVFNILGRKVDTIADLNQKAGLNFYKWDGSNFSSGIYFYRLTSGDFSVTRRMVLLK